MIRFRLNAVSVNCLTLSICLLARTKTMEELITELLFADDCALLAYMEEDLQHIVNCFFMQPKPTDSSSALRRLMCFTNPFHHKCTVLLRAASMAPTSTQWNTLFSWVLSSPLMPWSTACPKPAVPLEASQRECGRVIYFTSPQRSRYTESSLFPPSCMVQRTGFFIKSKSD